MRYQRVENVAWRRVGGMTVIVNLGRRRMLAVNEAGGAVWDALLAGKAPALPGDVGPFLADLEAEGIVERLAGDEAGTAAAMPPGSAPTVVWREELHNFGGGCSFFAGGGDLCNDNPSMS